jgi:multicomponent Na+:H+ antiporter subunit G
VNEWLWAAAVLATAPAVLLVVAVRWSPRALAGRGSPTWRSCSASSPTSGRSRSCASSSGCTEVRDAAVTVLLVAGVACAVLATLGTLLMRGTLDRLHFAGATVPAALCVAAAVIVRESASLISNKAIAIALMTLVVSPVLTHATARTVRALGERDR